MARATCRCGQDLQVPANGASHMTCPRCSAKVRLIRKTRLGDGEGVPVASSDGFIRFNCPCGRRLKVSATDRPTHGKCPDCDRIVPVPEGVGAGIPLSTNSAETPTDEFAPSQVAAIETWIKGHTGAKSTAEMAAEAVGRRGGEAGLRVCPRCGKPIHLGADACRGCGISVPKR